MTTNWIIRFIDGSTEEVSESTGRDLQARSNTGVDFFTVRNVTRNFKSVSFLGSKEDYQAQYAHETKYDYHQPYSEGMGWDEIKALPASGYGGVIKSAKKVNHRAALIRGLQKAKKRLGGETPNIAAMIKAIETGQKIEQGVYNVKYDHVRNEKGEIVKYAWEVRAEAEKEVSL